MKRNQTFHETLIPLLVEGIGAQSYLEFGVYDGSTIGKVRCEKRYGVDIKPLCDIPGVQMFAMTTREFIDEHAWIHGSFDFVFIDADHSAKAARADFMGIWPFVAPEGIVCLHDTNPETIADTQPGYCGDSWIFAQSLYVEGYEAVTLPYHPGLTIVRKRVSWGPK